MVRLIPFVLALAWGLNWPAVKIALSAVHPFPLRVFILGTGALILMAVTLLRGRSLAVPREAWGRLLFASLLNIAIFNLVVSFAQIYTSTSRAAVLTFSVPIWSTIFAYFLLGERLSRIQAVALGTGTIGLLLLAVPTFTGHASLLGLALPILGAVTWAAGSVFQKWRPIPGNRTLVTAWQLLLAAIMIAIGGFFLGTPWPALPLPGAVVVALSFQLLIATALAYPLWFVLLDRESMATAALTTLAVPVVGVLSAMLFVGDRPSALDWCGFVVTLAAAGLIMLGPRPAATKIPAAV